MKKIKVLHLLHSVGGVDVSLRLIVENIDTNKVDTVVVHGLKDTKRLFRDRHNNAIQTYQLPIEREIHPWKDLVSVFKTISILRRERPDVIHAHSAKGGIIARAASIFFKRTVLHTPQAYSFMSEPAGLKRKLFLGIEQLFRRINSVLLASSESERQRGMKEVGYKPERALLFSNSIRDIAPEQMMDPQLELPEEYICTVGRPSFQKNIEWMIEVVNKLKEKQPNVHLVVMGVGEYSPNKEAVEQLIAGYGLKDHVTMIPWIEREKIFSIIKKSQLYVSTARYEGLPYSIIESLALGKACVVTDCDGNRDLVEDGMNGYVIHDHSVDRMANCIFALISDPAKRAEFERHSRSRFEKEFDMEKNIKLLEEIYFNQVKE